MNLLSIIVNDAYRNQQRPARSFSVQRINPSIVRCRSTMNSNNLSSIPMMFNISFSNRRISLSFSIASIKRLSPLVWRCWRYRFYRTRTSTISVNGWINCSISRRNRSTRTSSNRHSFFRSSTDGLSNEFHMPFNSERNSRNYWRRRRNHTGKEHESRFVVFIPFGLFSVLHNIPHRNRNHPSFRPALAPPCRSLSRCILSTVRSRICVSRRLSTIIRPTIEWTRLTRRWLCHGKIWMNVKNYSNDWSRRSSIPFDVDNYWLNCNGWRIRVKSIVFNCFKRCCNAVDRPMWKSSSTISTNNRTLPWWSWESWWRRTEKERTKTPPSWSRCWNSTKRKARVSSEWRSKIFNGCILLREGVVVHRRKSPAKVWPSTRCWLSCAIIIRCEIIALNEVSPDISKSINSMKKSRRGCWWVFSSKLKIVSPSRRWEWFWINWKRLIINHPGLISLDLSRNVKSLSNIRLFSDLRAIRSMPIDSCSRNERAHRSPNVFYWNNFYIPVIGRPFSLASMISSHCHPRGAMLLHRLFDRPVLILVNIIVFFRPMPCINLVVNWSTIETVLSSWICWKLLSNYPRCGPEENTRCWTGAMMNC